MICRRFVALGDEAPVLSICRRFGALGEGAPALASGLDDDEDACERSLDLDPPLDREGVVPGVFGRPLASRSARDGHPLDRRGVVFGVFG